MKTFDEVVGMGYLKAIHCKVSDGCLGAKVRMADMRAVNDSKAPFASHRDLHANIGTGFLGLRAFHNVMNFAPFQNIPVVLETPIEVKGPDGKMIEDKQIWADEIKLLESLIEADMESAELLQKEKELQEKGLSERKRIQEQVDKRAEKDAEKAKKEALKEAKKGTKEKGSMEKFLTKKKPKKAKEKEKESGCDSCGESDGE
jgi:AP endonuclease-1